MALYHGPKCRLCRREGTKLMLKGERCKTEKCAYDRRPFPPGIKQTKRRRSTSEYNTQLREKQKLRRIYGIMERQFRNYFKKAAKAEGVTGESLLRSLELRFDNLVYRMGFAPSRSSARQLVLHNHFFLNDKKVNIPSFQLKEGDVIKLKEKSKRLEHVHSSMRAAKEIPDWLDVDKVKLSGRVARIPDRASMPINIEEQLVVELYSK